MTIPLPSPIKVQPPAINIPGKASRTFPAIELTRIDFNTVVFDDRKKVCSTLIENGINRHFPLWSGSDYPNATRDGVEARMAELLGENPATVLQGLF